MASFNTELWRALSEYRVKSLSQSLEDLLTGSINISEGIRSTASASQQNLRKFLQDECDRDSGFPPILSNADSDFLGGSFARHTKTRPLDDIDIYLPLEGANLFYYMHGTVLPYTVLTDGLSWSPLLTPRWADGQFISSSKLIDGFASVLQRKFPQTEINPSGEAVSVRMTMGASSASEGLGYDVVPCFSLAPQQQGEQPFYLIPDGKNGWIRTNPKKDANVAEVLQEIHSKTFRKAVKLLKYWNIEQLNRKLESYFIELAIAKVFWDKAVKSESVAPLSYGVALAFWAVQQAVTQGAQQSWVPNAPLVTPGTLLAGHQIMLRSATHLACGAWEDETTGKLVSAAGKWKRVFGDKFHD
jgi:hypothetical protein